MRRASEGVRGAFLEMFMFALMGIGVLMLAGGGVWVYNIQVSHTQQSEKIEGLEKMVSLQRGEVAALQEKLGVFKAETQEEVRRVEETAGADTEEARRIAQEAQKRLEQEQAQRIASDVEQKAAFEERISLSSRYDLASIVAAWRPFIAHVECQFREEGTGRLYYQASGSGVLAKFGNQPTWILTNRHILLDPDGFSADTCKATLVDEAGSFLVERKDMHVSTNEHDWGYLELANPNQQVQSLLESPFKICIGNPGVGGELLILGYPQIGSQGNITATEGIISGNDNDYYITSAKVAKGNSGGAAILLEEDCLLGIPTFAALDEVESLARILDIEVIAN